MELVISIKKLEKQFVIESMQQQKNFYYNIDYLNVTILIHIIEVKN